MIVFCRRSVRLAYKLYWAWYVWWVFVFHCSHIFKLTRVHTMANVFIVLVDKLILSNWSHINVLVKVHTMIYKDKWNLNIAQVYFSNLIIFSRLSEALQVIQSNSSLIFTSIISFKSYQIYIKCIFEWFFGWFQIWLKICST